MSVAFQLDRDARGGLRLVLNDGASHDSVTVVRAFPLSDPAHAIAICDAAGHELVFIDDPAELPPEVRTLVEEELGRREFLPRILRILSVRGETDPSHWRVVTDRGTTQFDCEGEDAVRRFGTGQAMIVDTHGIRYLVPDVQRLDASSRRLLERYL